MLEVEPDFLAFLFDLPPTLRHSLSRQVLEENKGVTCLHVFLAALCSTISIIATGDADIGGNGVPAPGILRIQREADLIRAAAGLPGICNLISWGNFSAERFF